MEPIEIWKSPTVFGEDTIKREVHFSSIPCPICGKEVNVYLSQFPPFHVTTRVGRIIRIWNMKFGTDVSGHDVVSISPSIDLSELKDHKCHFTITNHPFIWYEPKGE